MTFAETLSLLRKKVEWLTLTTILPAIFSLEAAALNLVEERLKNDPLMMPYYTGEIMPLPREVAYGERLISLDNAAVVTGAGLDGKSPVIRLLSERITQYGGHCEIRNSMDASESVVIAIGETPLGREVAVPQVSEGYAIQFLKKNGKTVIVLKGFDTPGLTWSVSSLIQLIHWKEGHCRIREAQVSDYPAFHGRAYLSTVWPWRFVPVPDMDSGIEPGAFYSIRFKANTSLFHNFRPRQGPFSFWRAGYSRSVKEELCRVGELLNPLGLDWYVEFLPYTCIENEQINSKGDEDFATSVKINSELADAGGNFFWSIDDYRYPLHPEDRKNFGTAREADIYVINRVFGALRAKYPRKRMISILPFYWGPDGGHTSMESREKYLQAVGERLPKEIGIFWTGPRVKTYQVKKCQMEWIAGLLRRKPLYWQNTLASHLFLTPLIGDEINWPAHYYPGFLNDIDMFAYNSQMPANAAVIATLMDYLWNPDRYDPKRSAGQAVKTLLGAENLEDALTINKNLSAFDEFGERITPKMAARYEELKGHVESARVAWNRIVSRRPAVEKWTETGRQLAWYSSRINEIKEFQRRFLLNADALEEVKKQAIAEAKLIPEVELFFNPTTLKGGAPAKYYAIRCPRRYATWIKRGETFKIDFEVEPFPPEGDYEIIASALDDDRPSNCHIRILVNAAEVFNGPNPFESSAWQLKSFTLPGRELKRHNLLTIANADQSPNAYFMVNYLIIRKKR